ncbi:hypothetical protein WME99_18755 [Sorangium sp. So ce136]|uniref:hypothetical protein n=1 Tax=Sorangium sp. So ce136 TaxID=3133284 RepID=UPI003EFFCCD3
MDQDSGHHLGIVKVRDHPTPTATRAGEDIFEVHAAKQTGPVEPRADDLHHAAAEAGPAWARARHVALLGHLVTPRAPIDEDRRRVAVLLLLALAPLPLRGVVGCLRRRNASAAVHHDGAARHGAFGPSTPLSLSSGLGRAP